MIIPGVLCSDKKELAGIQNARPACRHPIDAFCCVRPDNKAILTRTVVIGRDVNEKPCRVRVDVVINVRVQPPRNELVAAERCDEVAGLPLCYPRFCTNRKQQTCKNRGQELSHPPAWQDFRRQAVPVVIMVEPSVPEPSF